MRQTAALPGADPRKHALTTVQARDGTRYLDGDALHALLAEGPLSVWALVGRTVQMLGKPVPDIEGIFKHVSQTVGTGAFGVPRVPDGHRPHLPAVVYLRQIWPQILPIAQKFCSKPAQIPVLFGIALQRAIEQTQGVLSPTLSASIAMECAVAMSKVALPDAYANPVATWPAAVGTRMSAPPMPMSAPMRADPAHRLRSARGAEPSAGVGAFFARLPQAAGIVAIASLAFITIAGAMYKADRREVVEVVREERAPQSQELSEPARVLEQATSTPEVQASQEQLAREEPLIAQDVSATSATPEEPAERQMREDRERRLQSGSNGSDEMVMSADNVF